VIVSVADMRVPVAEVPVSVADMRVSVAEVPVSVADMRVSVAEGYHNKSCDTCIPSRSNIQQKLCCDLQEVGKQAIMAEVIHNKSCTRS